MPLVSVIVPVYNAQSTIVRCLSSILSTDASVEVICVNDGSVDESLDKLYEIAKEDQRVIIIDQQNQGAGKARNTAIERANGKYVMFCDADDAYEVDVLPVIFADLKVFRPDYLVFHRKTVSLDNSVQYWGSKCAPHQIPGDYKYYFNNVFYQRRHGGGVVNKVFKKDIITNNKIQFGEKYVFGEDFWFLLHYLMHASNMYEDYSVEYIQYQTEGSICQRRYDNFFELNTQWVADFRMTCPEVANSIKYFFSQYFFYSAQRALYKVAKELCPERGINEKRRYFYHLCDDQGLREALDYLVDDEGTPKSIRTNIQFYRKRLFVLYWGYNFVLPDFKRRFHKIIKR